MAHNFNTIEGTEVFNVNDAVQGSHALTLDDVKEFVKDYIIEITYSELSTLITNSELIPGQKYLLSDYQTVHTIPTTVDLNTGPTEPLIVTALSSNELEPIAFSTLYPNDIIYYHHENGNALFPGSIKGYISRRIDTLYNNSIGNDFRNCKYRRYKLNVTIEWDGITAYAQQGVVKKTGTEEIYIALKANTNVALTETGTWMRYPYNNATYNGSPQAGLVNIPYDALDFQDVVLFSDGYNNTIINNTIDFVGLYDSKIGVSFSNNFIQGHFVGNIIGSSFYNNIISGSFYNNVVGTSFGKNIIRHQFNDNSVGNRFYSNYTGTDFRTNIISNDFISNNIQGFFKSNKVGFSCYSNAFLDEFGSNVIGNSCVFNQFGIENKSNTILNGFTQNILKSVIQGIDFSLSTHVYLGYSCDIFKIPNGGYKLSYIDNAGVNQIVDPTT